MGAVLVPAGKAAGRHGNRDRQALVMDLAGAVMKVLNNYKRTWQIAGC